MRLVIGGYGQGKLEFVLGGLDVSEYGVWDGELPGDGELSGDGELPGVGEVPRDRELPGDGKWNGFPVVNHFHRWVRGRLMDGGCPEAEISAFLDRCEDCVIICDEIGSGIVPGDGFEREYRERTGRILIELAARAERVERVICGIGQRIK